MTTISLVIPTLNEEETISKLLLSAKNQNHKFNEIIVVDSGSTDNTILISKKIIKQTIITGKRCINYNRNIGIRSATSEIVCCVDGDCILPKEYTEAVLKSFETPNTVALIAPVFPIEKHITLKILRGLNNIQLYIFSHITGSIRPYAANMPFLRKAYINSGGFPNLSSTDIEETELYSRFDKMGIVSFSVDSFVYTSSRKLLDGNNRVQYEDKKDCMELV